MCIIPQFKHFYSIGYHILIGFDSLSYVTLRFGIIQVTLQRRKQHVVVQRIVQLVNLKHINSLLQV